MAIDFLEQIRLGLLERRSQLVGWLNTAPAPERETRLGPSGEEEVLAHLQTIDESLEKAETGDLGRCTVCHGYVDLELLEMDYTADVCLGHLSDQELSDLETELSLAQTVQKSLLPQQTPASEFLEIAAFSRPAQVIGGDYFDFFEFGDGTHGIAIADVAGHGISAALHMASIQALLRTLIPASDSPLQVVRHIQKLLIHNIRFSNFVTIFLASYDPAGRTLRYCNAGHNPPIWASRKSDGRAALEWLSPTGAAVGLVEGLRLEENTIRPDPGDRLVLYTDGITEAMNLHGEQFGYDRLAELVSRTSNGSSSGLLHAIRQELMDFTAGQVLADDATLLVCHILA